MQKATGRYTKIGCAVVVGMMMSHAQLALAGWTGLMNGTGFGKVTVNVVSVEEVSGSVTTTNMQDPSAAMTKTNGYVFGAPLPSKSSPATVAKVKGSTGYVWQATTVGSAGDSTDSSGFESVIIIPADCPALEMFTTSSIAGDKKSGTITVEATATAGTGLRVIGYEMVGALPEDNLSTTTINETLEFLKTNGVVRFDHTLLGPQSLSTLNCSALVIQFTVETTTDNLYFVTYGVAKSKRIGIIKPENVIVECDEQPVVYPGVSVSSCRNSGPITVTYDPPFPHTFSLGTNTVMVIAKEGGDSKATNFFTVTVKDTKAPVITATGTPANGALGFNPTATQIGDALGTATASDCGVVTPTATDSSVIVDGCSRSQTRTWNVTDAAGNPATPVSRTATWTVDTTPPLIPVLLTVTGACGAPVTLPVPTTTDNCGGPVTVTPSGPQVVTTPGTNVVTWIFTDAAGNRSTNTQTVIVKGIKFDGFESPISGTGGSCGSPLRSINQGSNIPVKFETECDGSYITSGQPTLSIEKSNAECTTLTAVGGGNFTLVGNEWHFNWDTSGIAKATYKLTATLQDGSKKFVWVKIK